MSSVCLNINHASSASPRTRSQTEQSRSGKRRRQRRISERFLRSRNTTPSQEASRKRKSSQLSRERERQPSTLKNISGLRIPAARVRVLAACFFFEGVRQATAKVRCRRCHGGRVCDNSLPETDTGSLLSALRSEHPTPRRLTAGCTSRRLRICGPSEGTRQDTHRRKLEDTVLSQNLSLEQS